MSDDIARALPGEYIDIAMNAVTEPFWTHAREARLVAPRCGDCNRFRMPPSPFCPHCRSEVIDWVPLSGLGRVFSFTICRRSPFNPAEALTYVPAVVELPDADGVRLVTNIVDVPVAEVAIGLAVMVDWTPIRGGWQVPIFRPV